MKFGKILGRVTHQKSCHKPLSAQNLSGKRSLFSWFWNHPTETSNPMQNPLLNPTRPSPYSKVQLVAVPLPSKLFPCPLPQSLEQLSQMGRSLHGAHGKYPTSGRLPRQNDELWWNEGKWLKSIHPNDYPPGNKHIHPKGTIKSMIFLFPWNVLVPWSVHFAASLLQVHRKIM